MKIQDIIIGLIVLILLIVGVLMVKRNRGQIDAQAAKSTCTTVTTCY